MAIFSLIGHIVPVLSEKSDNWRQICIEMCYYKRAIWEQILQQNLYKSLEVPTSASACEICHYYLELI